MTALRTLACVLLFALAGHAGAQALRDVRVEGAVRAAGGLAAPEGTRLAQALLAAEPDADAYVLGAAFLRRDAAEQQLRLKAGLRHSLQTLQQGDSAHPDIVAVAARMDARLRDAPVTGRVRANLSPRRVEIDPEANVVLRDGDRIVYPRRPDTIRVVGAVREACTLAHQPLRDAAGYLAECPRQAADPDWLYVVQPDGEVQRLGIAIWNRSPAQALAPGAWLYAPLPARALRDVDPLLNEEFALFLATQLVDVHAGEGP